MEAEEEKKKMMEKYFNCAEAPIIEWVAEYLGQKAEDVFPDCDDDSDDIGFQYDGAQYNAYLLSMEPGTKSHVPADLLDKSDDVQKACSILYDAVQQVMPCVVQTVDKEYADKLKGLHCQFDNSTMSYGFVAVNVEEYKKVMAVQQYQKLVQFKEQVNSRLAEPEISEEEKTSLQNRLKDADNLIAKAKQAYEMITEDILKAEEERCVALTKDLEKANRLYIVVEKVKAGDVDAINEGMKRLPAFGNAYQDTEDETFTEKIKREYKLNE